VVLCVLVPLAPFGWEGHFVAIPVGARLYRKPEACEQEGREFQNKSELLVDMMQGFVTHVDPDRPVWLFVDGGYSNGTVLQGLPERVEVFGRIRGDAQLYALPPEREARRGRPRERGERLPSPHQLLQKRRGEWETVQTDHGHEVALGKQRALWWRVARSRPISVVMVHCPHRRHSEEYFFTTVCELSARQVCELIERRWAIEVLFRDLKQHLGLETPQNRTPRAVERTAALLFLVGGLVTYWFLKCDAAERDRLLEQYAPESRAAGDEGPPSFAKRLRLLRLAIWDHRIKLNSHPFPDVNENTHALLCYLAAVG